MKTFLITTIAFLAFAINCKAQWTSTPPNIYYNTGNVGIGTTSPSYPLTLNNASETGIQTIYNGTSIYLSHGGWGMGAGKFGIGNGAIATLVINTVANGGGSVGNVGIGTASPIAPFHVYTNTDVYGIVIGDGSNSNLRISGTAGGSSGYGLLQTFISGGSTAGGVLSLQRDAGNVSIGTSDSKGYRLAVNGTAIATSMTVKAYANWPDFVFKPTYKLPTLPEVKTYINQNHHLPGVPAAAEMEKNGINLGEMNMTLLKKVEELTLYLIEKDKQIKVLEQQTACFQSLQKQIDDLKKSRNNPKNKN